MPAVLLPRMVGEKLEDLAVQVRRLWLYRGISRWIVAVIASVMAALLLDRFVNFGPAGRWLLLAAWLAVVAFAAWRLIVVPRRRFLSSTQLAAAIEAQFPSLSERLMTIVELSESKDGHGSKALMDLLARDIAHRTKRLDFERAAPSASTLRGVLLAGLMITLAVTAIVTLTGGTARLKRFLLPWYTQKIEAPFIIRCSSGSVAVKRGEAVTLTAYLDKKLPDAVLPTAATLVMKDEHGTEKQFPMAGAETAAFHITLPSAANSFDYRVTAGEQTSDWHKVTVSDTVELSEGTTLSLTPPAYAVPPLKEEAISGFSGVTALQYSELKAVLKFSRPAEQVSLDWLPAAGVNVSSIRISLNIAADRRSATAGFPLMDSGTLRLSITGERGVKTSFSAAVKVLPDAAPRFEKAVGIVEKPRSVQPSEAIVLEALAVDDVKIDWLGVEYSVNGQAAVMVPWTVKEPGLAKAEGKYVFKLAGLVKDGDTLTYRLKATDNRKIDKKLGPQSVYYPEAAWAKLTISNTAEPLDRQDVLAQKDAIAAKLAEAKIKLHEARKAADDLERELGPKPMLATDEIAKLRNIRDVADKAKLALEAAAKEAALTPELRGLADAMRTVARDPVTQAEEQLKRSEHEAKADDRNARIREAEKQLQAARDRVEELERRNTELAKNRLDRRKFQKLAEEVRNLAEEAEKATTETERDAIRRKIEQRQEELRDLIKGNDALKQGVEDVTNDEAKKLADEAGKLEQAQRDLNDSIERGNAAARAKALEGTTAKQDDAAAKAEELRKKTEGAMKRSGEEPLANEPFDKASDKLRKGDAVGAMTEQEKAARELDRLAEQLEKAANARKEPREAANQLAKLQDELRDELQKAVKEKLTPEDAKRLQEKQRAVEKALDKLETPANDATSAKDKAEALERMRKAREAMEADPATAAAEQQAAAEELRKLAKNLPSREERLKAAKYELEQLTRQQTELQREAEAKLKPFEKRRPDEFTQREVTNAMKELAAKEKALAEKLETLDAPGLEERRNATAASAKRAAEDLQKGLPQDIPASQADLKRRLSQLRTAMDGGIPNDAAADELARLQDRIAEKLANGQPDGNQLADLQKLQREVADRLGVMNDPDAAERLKRAKSSTNDAAKQFQNGDDLDELRKKTKQAANDLNELADQLAGVEPDSERLDRLAKQRKEQAEWSKANASKATPPDTAAAKAGELERELDDLKKSRAGAAQQEKKAAVDALERLQRTPNAERAPGLQKEAADALEQLAKKNRGKPNERGGRPKDGDASGDAEGQLPNRVDAQAARDLAEKMRELKDQTAKNGAQAKPGPEEAAARDAEQKKLADQADQLAKNLEDASHSPTNDAADAGKLTKAAEAAKEAKGQMEKAAREEGAGRGRGAEEARGQAMKNLADAKAEAQSAAKPKGGGDKNSAEAGKAAEEAGAQMRAAGKQPGQEAGPLKKAAEKLDEAADKLEQAGQEPGGNTGTGDKALTQGELPPDLKEYAGKPWGDLPGEVKAKIISDLKSKYGEDYARVIKLYFEQQAEGK